MALVPSPAGRPALVVATLTPFERSGGVDADAAGRLARRLVDAGVDGLAPTGTTGEFLYLSEDEKARVHEATAEASPRPVIPCVWDPRLPAARRLARRAEALRAAAVFLPPPLYHPVPDDTVVAWYAEIREATDLPVLAYHHPRVHNPIDAGLLDRLVAEVGIAGMKDSSGDPERVRSLATAHPGRVWAGGDHLLGADLGPIAGHISRMANLYPALCLALVAGLADSAEMAGRIEAVRSAGGIAAMKAALGLGCRMPISEFDGERVRALPPDLEGSTT